MFRNSIVAICLLSIPLSVSYSGPRRMMRRCRPMPAAMCCTPQPGDGAQVNCGQLPAGVPTTFGPIVLNCPLFIVYQDSTNPDVFCYYCDGMDSECLYQDSTVVFKEETSLSGVCADCFPLNMLQRTGVGHNIVFNTGGNFTFPAKAIEQDPQLRLRALPPTLAGYRHLSLDLNNDNVDDAWFRLFAVKGWEGSDATDYRLIALEVTRGVAPSPKRIASSATRDPKVRQSVLSVPGHVHPLTLIRSR